jgi:DNA-binding response OmpR family regulator
MDTAARLNGERADGGRTNGLRPASAATLLAGRPVPAASAARQLVLVVEDDPHDFEIYGKVLWYNGFDVLYAADGESAIQLARRHAPDLILLDLGLPRVDGLSVGRRLRETADTAGIPIIVLTGRRLEEVRTSVELLGLARFLEKPMSPIEVLHAVEAVIGRPPLAGIRTEQPRAARRTDAA